MIRLTTFAVALLVLLISGTGLAQSESDPQAQKGASDSEQAQKPVKDEMNSLAAKTFEMAFQAISKGGNFYPFTMFMENGKTRSFAFNMKGEQDPPPQQKWLKHLFSKMRTKVKTTAGINVVTIAKMHQAAGSEKTPEGEQKKDVPGVWVLIDHRDVSPVVAFMPLVPQEDGSHKPGQMVYSGTNNWIFPSSKGNRDR